MGEVNQAPLRILHIPCNTPYVRKIKKAGKIEIVNGIKLSSNEHVPLEITYQWISEHKNNQGFWNSFDVCHLHYGFEFESIEAVEMALKLLQRHHKPIVYTCHELCSAHGVFVEQYRWYVALILEYATSVITLTNGAKAVLAVEHPQVSVTVIPHGFVWFPQTTEVKTGNVPEILFFGAIRSNRDVPTTMTNLLFGIEEGRSRVSWVTRPFTQEQLENSATLRMVLELAMRNPLVRVELSLPLTDREVADQVSKVDILALPYISAGHSGQLELAYDCGVLPVITNVGFLSAQHQMWSKENSEIPHIIEVDWSDGKSWLYQARFLQGVREALKILPTFKQSLNWGKRRSFRAEEYERFLNDHLTVYRKSIREKG